MDVIHGADPTSTANIAWNKSWSLKNLAITVDDTVAGSFPHRWPGKWYYDASMTAGSAVITIPSRNIGCGDVGQNILVKGAGPSGGNLSTTVLSVTPCTQQTQTITLATAASTTVSNATYYITPAGIPLATTIGACGLAMDDEDGNSSDWQTQSTQLSNLADNIENVTFLSVSGTPYGQNNSCGIYTQGVWGPYNLDVRNFAVLRTVWGIVQGTSELNSGSQSSSNDFQNWNHGSISSVAYPWISYNGGYNHLDQIELTVKYGPQILTSPNQWGDAASAWYIDIPEMEGTFSSSQIGWRLEGNFHTVTRTSFGGSLASSGSPTPHIWNASNSRCIECAIIGNLTVTGSLNSIANDAISDGSWVTFTDRGYGNDITSGYIANSTDSVGPTRRSLQSVGRGPVPAGAQTADFVRNGNTANPYISDLDLLFFPEDFLYQGATPNVVQDSASWTGRATSWPSGFSAFNFANLLLNNGRTTNPGNQILIGTNVPATNAIVYISARCTGTTSYSINVQAGSTNLTSGSTGTCNSSTYTTSSVTVNLSSYAGQYLGFTLNPGFGGPTLLVSWAAVRPYQADYNGYQPAHSGANTDITSLTGLTTPLSTTQGGTGAGALTGYRYANGSGADTAATTIPKSAIGGQAGSGAGLVTGPTTSVSGDVVTFTGTAGQAQDSGVSLNSLAPLASPTFTGNTITFANGAAAEQDLVIKPGSSADQIGAYALANYSGTTQWKLRKDASNYLRLTDAVNSLDREILYQNGQTIINAGAGSNAVVINGTANSGAGGLLVQSGGSSPATVLTVTASGNTTATGFVAGKSYMGSGTMTLASGAAAGTSPTIACATSHVCDGVSGEVALTTGTSPTTGTLATLTFPSAHTNYANCIVGVSSSSAQLTTVTWSETAAAVTLTANSALTASTAYQLRYWCGGN